MQAAHEAIDALNLQARELREVDTRRSLELARAADGRAQAAAYPRGVVDSLATRIHCGNWLSTFAESLALGNEALRLAETLPDYPGQADLALGVARAHLGIANFSESARIGRQALEHAVRLGDGRSEADALTLLGINYYRTGAHDRAFAKYERALALHRALGNPRGACKVLVNIAQAHSTLGQFEQALARALEGLEQVRAIGARMIEAYLLHTLGQVYADKGDFDEALDYLAQSLPVAAESGAPYVHLVSVVAMGQVHARRQELAEAEARFSEALDAAVHMQSRLYVFRCHQALADLHEARGDHRRALEHYKQFHAVKELVFNEQTMGRLQSLELDREIERARQEAEIYQLRNVALEQEIAERRRLEEELQRQASTDSLTGALNRRRFQEVTTIEIARALRYHRPLTLALMDLDHFKAINDTHGHAAGDQALKTLAARFQASIREVDVFARFGGDEFALLLPDTTPVQACVVIERVRNQLGTEPLVVDGAALRLRISVGLAGINPGQDTLDALSARADVALYQAKQAGRDRVVLG